MTGKIDLNSEKMARTGKFVTRIFTSYRGAWFFIFACWMVPFFAAWPGVFVIDNVFQMKWFLEGRVSAHHR